MIVTDMKRNAQLLGTACQHVHHQWLVRERVVRRCRLVGGDPACIGFAAMPRDGCHEGVGRRALGCDPALDLRLQHLQRDGAVLQDFDVERADVEVITQCFLCDTPQTLDLEHADLVAERLARPDGVAFDLGFRLERCTPAVVIA